MPGDERLWAGTEASLKNYLDAEERGQALEAKAGDDDDEEGVPHLLDVQGNVGVISIKGPLTNRDSYWNRFMGVTSYNDIRKAVIAAATNQDVSTLLLDIDSGGGAVSGVMDTANLIRLVNDKVKPVASFADGTMASAAYWLGASAGRVYAGRTAMVGSIGVILMHMEYSKALKEDGVGVTVMRAGKYKALANPYEPLSEEGKASLQKILDATYNVFIGHVADLRGKTVTYVDEKMAQGREFIGEESVGAGLVDAITTYDTLLSDLGRQTIDNSQAFKQKSYQLQDSSYQRNGDMGKKALTDSDIAALAEGAAAQTEEHTAAAAETDAAAEAEASQQSEPAAEAAFIEASVDEGAVVSLLRTQLAEKDTALLQANVELAQIRTKHTEFAAVVDSLASIVAKSLSNLSVALGGTAIDASTMPHASLVVEHNRLSEQFKTKFKAGGVAAVDAADATADAQGKVDPLQRARLAAVRSTAKAKQ